VSIVASLSSEFHATLEELIDLVRTAMTTYGVYATAEAFPPVTIFPVRLEELEEVMHRPNVLKMVFTEGPPRFSAQSNLRFLQENPGSMSLHIGRMGPRGLQESGLSTLDAKPTWKNIARDLKRRTKAGAATLHEESGARGYDRIHRYTPGAETLQKAGTPMRQYTQLPVLFLFGDGANGAADVGAKPVAGHSANPTRATRAPKKRSSQ
jgi:hypothetical protein